MTGECASAREGSYTHGEALRPSPQVPAPSSPARWCCAAEGRASVLKDLRVRPASKKLSEKAPSALSRQPFITSNVKNVNPPLKMRGSGFQRRCRAEDFRTPYKERVRVHWVTPRKGINLLINLQRSSPSPAYWLSNCHLEGLAHEKHYHGSAGVFLVGREHKMPELSKKKTKSYNSNYLISPFFPASPNAACCR